MDFNKTMQDVETISGQHSLLCKSSSEAALPTRPPPPDEMKNTNWQRLFPSIISNGKSLALFLKKADLSVGGAPSDGRSREEVLLDESRRLVSSISP